MDTYQKNDNLSPEVKANIFSRLLFCWMLPFLKQGKKNDIKMKDIYNVPEKIRSDGNGDVFERNWYDEVKNANIRNEGPSIVKVLLKTFGLSYMKLGWWLLIYDTIKTVQPIVLAIFLRLFQDDNGQIDIETEWILGGIIFLTSLLSSLIFHQYCTQCQIIGLKVKSACFSLVYRKILKLSHLSLGQITSGEVVNLLSNDIQRIDQVIMYLHFLYIAPLSLIIRSCIMYKIIGISSIPGLVFNILGFPISAYLSKVQGRLRSRIALLTGERLAVMSNIISGIQVIKMYAWEKPFEAILAKARKLEFNVIAKASYIRVPLFVMIVGIEKVSFLLTIVTYVLLGNKLKADLVFSFVLFFYLIQSLLCNYLPTSFEYYAQTKVTINRLEKFLLLNEKETVASITKISTATNKNHGAIKLADITAGWLPNSLTLSDITLNIKPGTLCCVLGKVGAGKTSFLHLLLEELPLSNGTVNITGKISYASQEPWLFAGSVKNNILFSQKFLNNKYQDVIRVCALNKDFQQLPYSDQTMVGERGVSLSGGQRVRINLARAVYLDADIYLLDDPLSAVDPRVAKYLFEKCIKEYLQNKTRVLVTHQLQFVRQADLVVVLEEGKICKLINNDEVTDSLRQLNEVCPNEERCVEEKIHKSYPPMKRSSILSYSSTTNHEEELHRGEEMISNKVSLSTYIKYFSSGNRTWFLIMTFIIFMFGQAVSNLADLCLRYWINEEQLPHPKIFSHNFSNVYTLQKNIVVVSSTNLTSSLTDPNEKYFYIYVYSGLVLGGAIVHIIRPTLLYTVCLNASRALHNNMLGSILRAPMKFFETNPSGRILNRFSKDVGSVDETLPYSITWGCHSIFFIIGTIVTICVVAPWTIVPLIFVTILAYYVVDMFSPPVLKISKLEANNCSPIYSLVSITVSGLTTVRSAEAEDTMRKYFDSLQDLHTSTLYMATLCSRSYCLYVEGVLNIFLGVILLKYLIFRNANTYSSDVGLVISQMFILTAKLQYGVNRIMHVINTMESVERILQYTNIEKEEIGKSPNTEVEKQWPCSGRIIFTNVFLTYAPEEPAVLKNVNFNIRPAEKIGIVGRTGAGKSSLISCLFRLAPAEGTITIDAVNIAEVDLNTLRTNISIIPQEPVLFCATLRYNLDPFGNVSDDTLWRVLENVELKDAIENLDQKVSNGGSNFSVGQRQLICLARAILRNNKILVMDEATANVDPNTDALIQKTIRENFRNCTVLTIAHRLNTIMDSDRVLVMSSGQVVEFAHPHELLQQPDSHFSQMVKETDKAVENTLRAIAKEDYEKKFFDIS